jgi:hypothetical protein
MPILVVPPPLWISAVFACGAAIVALILTAVAVVVHRRIN